LFQQGRPGTHAKKHASDADKDLESVEILVSCVRANPGQFAGARDVAVRSGFDEDRFARLCRQHYHATPEDLLLRARLEAAKPLLLVGDHGAAAIAREVGFAAAALFGEAFARSNGLTPAAYRNLRLAQTFTVELPPDYPLNYL
jgi:AraC family transcriptional regulator of adaptative response / DNA-3-methyladenine glycosylase II